MRYFVVMLLFVLSFAMSCGKSNVDKAKEEVREAKEEAQKAIQSQNPKRAKRALSKAVEEAAEAKVALDKARKDDESPEHAEEVEKVKEEIEEAKEDIAEAKLSLKGEELFDEHTCSDCHARDYGFTKDPYPPKQRLANLSYTEYRKITIEGRPGTEMTPKDLTDDESKAIYAWLQKFKHGEGGKDKDDDDDDDDKKHDDKGKKHDD